ncbi:MAG: AgmX/PglI C-terminal domain-containing protein [Acidobacteriota bacterium]|nr:AgmX/PglI C-terminal domain-containing protein [Acidobacteriota bacterium]MDH3783691.1 AgmX/PglI C-terminal domain-containing protein [Acidobacteriota bacterium]
MNSNDHHELRARAEEVRSRVQTLTDDLRVVDENVDALAPQRMHHELLEKACSSLEKLGDCGVAALFWGEDFDRDGVSNRLREARGRIAAFRERVDALDDQRREILDGIAGEEQDLEMLGADLYYLRKEEERRKNEWVIEREVNPLPARKSRMPWARGGEDDRRFRRSLGGALMTSMLLGALLPWIPLPIPERFVPEDIPRRLAQLVREEKARLAPPPPAPIDKPEQRDEAEKPKPEEPPEPSEQPNEPDAIAQALPEPSTKTDELAPAKPSVAAPGPRTQVRTAGILAFKDKFAGLAKDKVAPKLGADARYGIASDSSAAEAPSRSMLTTNAPGSSGGINISSLSRNVGGGGGGGPGGGGGMHGVQIGRQSSSIDSIGGGGGDRPRAGGGHGSTRTDEEIQIVFDRYKAAFYRLYNRELRNDPTLRGQMVLRLTIEPDGSVSMCDLESTTINASDLATQVVNRVRMINFGAKEGVDAMTIVYPIDFLPKA